MERILIDLSGWWNISYLRLAYIWFCTSLYIHYIISWIQSNWRILQKHLLTLPLKNKKPFSCFPALKTNKANIGVLTVNKSFPTILTSLRIANNTNYHSFCSLLEIDPLGKIQSISSGRNQNFRSAGFQQWDCSMGRSWWENYRVWRSLIRLKGHWCSNDLW